MSGATAPLLSLRGVKAYYGSVIALKGVDVDVNEGEIVALIGANGAGKSTLMMTVFGNPRAREGSIRFAGRDITGLPTHEVAKLRIAQSPEGRRIFPRMTVMENLQIGATVADASRFRCRPRSRVRAVSAAARPPISARRHALGRRAADAGDRPRADEPAAAASCSTSLRSAWRRCSRSRFSPPSARSTNATSSPCFWSSRTPITRSSSRIAAMSWSTARSRCKAPGATCCSGRKSAPPISKAARAERTRMCSLYAGEASRRSCW